MSTLVYPESFLKPQLAGYALEPVNSLVQTELASGLMVQREIAPNAPWRSTLVWLGTADRIAEVHGWLVHFAKYGFFTVKLLTPNGGLTDHNARMISRLGQIRANGALFELSAQFEIKEISTLGEEAMLAAGTYGSDEIFAADDLAESLSNYMTDYPVENACS